MPNLDTPSPVLLSCHGTYIGQRSATNRNGRLLKRGLDGPTARPTPVLSCLWLPHACHPGVRQTSEQTEIRARAISGTVRDTATYGKARPLLALGDQRSSDYLGWLRSTVLQHRRDGAQGIERMELDSMGERVGVVVGAALAFSWLWRGADQLSILQRYRLEHPDNAWRELNM
ncbi:hypothetical protein K505DRAFT_114663 [Melanomma pulvis-pyrius CBS 109.77]|uniref:Uncharacterized protein n=1 Tax=Melanomma pulvis-pyrius CBS 109.77 TaxID=1314802 RepID=A0A6A6XPU0_9PLEO|nr:hypothetical protein K505DRAFT_114663 [Melanomma pulvis-pyrius CBS 109.77]